jgi:hypothetical protein
MSTEHQQYSPENQLEIIRQCRFNNLNFFMEIAERVRIEGAA